MEGISSLLLGVLASTAVSCGVIFTNDDSIRNLGYMFKNYCDSKSDELFQSIETAVALSATLNPSNYVEVDSSIMETLKDFLDGVFSGDTSFNVDANYVGTALGIPVYDLNHLVELDKEEGAVYASNNQYKLYLSPSSAVLGLYSTIYGSNGKVAQDLNNAVQTGDLKFYFNYIGSSNASLAFYGLNEGEWVSLGHGYNMPTAKMETLRLLLIRTYVESTFSYTYKLWIGYATTKTKYPERYDYIECTDIGFLANDIGIDYTGNYDWDDTLNDIPDEEEKKVALPIPDNLGDIVNQNKDSLKEGIDNGVIDAPSDGIITVPDVDNPSIDVPIDTPIDVPTDVPINPPIDVPIAPIIPPVIPPIDDDIEEGGDGEQKEDTNDKLSSKISEVSGGLYYYYIGDDVGDNKIDDVIGHATGVVSLSYTPYTWYSDLNITKLPYDKDRFNNVMAISDGFSVYRINDVSKTVKKVGGFKAFANNFSVNIGEGKPYNYMNETKLYQYPYSFAYVYDGINNPLEIKYHYLAYYYNDVYIKQTVSDKCTYSIFVKNYKGDREGNLESMVLTSGNELPCSSSTYAQWFATNRNQLAQNIQNIQNTNAIQNHGNLKQYEISKDMNTVNGIGQLISALGSVFSLDFGNAVGNVTNAINTTNTMRSQQAQLQTQLALNKVSEQNAIQSALALNNDMRNSPATLVSHGSNVFYGLVNNNKNLLLIRMGLHDEDYFRIGTYFTMFGYKQNKVLNINLRSRKYFNYFKIVSPNIIAPNVPTAHMEKIKEIFKEGITLWHYNNSNKILDYFHADNYEV